MTSDPDAPRYAPWVSLLREDSAHFLRSPSPAYWSLAPFYVGQFTESACSVASATMVINAVRACLNRGTGIRPATQHAVLHAAGSPAWRAGVERDDGHGATLRQLAAYLGAGLRAFTPSPVSIAVVALSDPSTAMLASFRESLRACEAGRDIWIVANYYMEQVIGSGDYGHFTPVGAYDDLRDRVLLLDVYRHELEPYWVPTERLFAGMSTTDKTDGEPRGYLVVQRPES